MPLTTEAMSRTPIVHHRPTVSKRLGVFWWSECLCGHANHYKSWKHALIDALIHSEELK